MCGVTAPHLLGVKKMVHQVEARLFEHDEQGKQQHEPQHAKRAGSPGKPGDETVGVKPHEDHHRGGPDGDTAHARVEHVVPHLCAGEELGIVLTLLSEVDSPFYLLVFERVEIERQSTDEQEGRDKIDRVDLRDPAGFKFDTALQLGAEKQPAGDGHRYVEQISGGPEKTPAEKKAGRG